MFVTEVTMPRLEPVQIEHRPEIAGMLSAPLSFASSHELPERGWTVGNHGAK